MRTPLTRDQQVLVQSAAYQASALARRLPDGGDGAPYEALCLLAIAFDPERHPSFDGYVRCYLRRRTIDLIRQDQRNRRGRIWFQPLSIDVEVGDDGDLLRDLLASSLPSPEDEVIDLTDEAPDVRSYAACLPDPYRSVILATLTDPPMTQQALARRLGVTESRVSQMVKAAMAELHDLIERYPSGSPGRRQEHRDQAGRLRSRRCVECREKLPPQYGRGRPATRCPDCRPVAVAS